MSKKKRSKVNDESELSNILNKSISESSEENNVPDDPKPKEVDLTEKVRELASNKTNLEFALKALKGSNDKDNSEFDELTERLREIDERFNCRLSSIYYAPPDTSIPTNQLEYKPKKRHTFILFRLFGYLRKPKKELTTDEIAFSNSNISRKDINDKLRKLAGNLFKDKEKEQEDLYDINIAKTISRAQAYDLSNIRMFGVNIIGDVVMVIMNNIWSLESRLGMSFVTKTHTTLILLALSALILPSVLLFLIVTLIKNFYIISIVIVFLVMLSIILLAIDMIYSIISYLRN